MYVQASYANIYLTTSITLQINADFSAFIRVRYDDELLKRLMAAVHDGSLNVLDRFCLANNSWALLRAGHMSAAQFFAFFAACSNETSHIVWQTLAGAIGSIRNVFQQSDAKLADALDRFVCNIIGPIGERLGWEAKTGEGEIKSRQGMIIQTSCRLAHDACSSSGSRSAR